MIFLGAMEGGPEGDAGFSARPSAGPRKLIMMKNLQNAKTHAFLLQMLMIFVFDNMFFNARIIMVSIELGSVFKNVVFLILRCILIGTYINKYQILKILKLY